MLKNIVLYGIFASENVFYKIRANHIYFLYCFTVVYYGVNFFCRDYYLSSCFYFINLYYIFYFLDVFAIEMIQKCENY